MPTKQHSKPSEKNNKGRGRPKKPILINKGDVKYKEKKIGSWSIYIHKVLKEVHRGDTSISRGAMLIMNEFLNDIFEKLATEASQLINHTTRKTILEDDIRTSVRLIIPGQLCSHAISEGEKAIRMYYQSHLRD